MQVEKSNLKGISGKDERNYSLTPHTTFPSSRLSYAPEILHHGFPVSSISKIF